MTHHTAANISKPLSFCSLCGCVCVRTLNRVWLSATPWAIAHQASLSMGFSRQEYWSGLPFPSTGDLPDPGIEPTSLASPALPDGFFTSCNFSSVQFSHVWLFATPWITARQASLSITHSRSLKLIREAENYGGAWEGGKERSTLKTV